MADTFINIDVSSGLSRALSGSINRKHKQFLRRRKYLEKRGFLKQKQLPNKKAGETRNAWGRSRPNGQAEGHGPGRQQDGSSRTVTVGAPCQPGTLSIGINCAANRPCPPTPSKDRPSPAMGGAKEPAKPLVPHRNLLLSEYESGLPSAAAVPPSHKVLAIDCEMVGTGFKGRNSALARCSIVNYQGDVVYDKYVRPACPVTDFRTRWSGIRREHLSNAIPFNVAQKEVLKLLHGKIVIGHAIQNDYKALGYFHPKEMTRDTSKIPLLNRKAGFPEKEPASLKRLAKQVLHKDIQVGKSGHSSVEDAKTTMELYRVVEAEYERELAAGTAQL
ncbi:interferon-stimulated 20 kDa exonuclease-like 2 isoform 1-T2 [Anomaloglossus baeobatrachus]|uniref:interferon-stimulated 20 kDa exonuclease-like 2 n=1 Tax=Anomaloglossus baeobatrachus TaxID=238106 RepID=UPI003F4FBD5D